MTGARICLACARPSTGHFHAHHDPACRRYVEGIDAATQLAVAMKGREDANR